MKIQNYEELKLGSDVFAEVRKNFDALLQKLFKKMEDNNSDEGIIDLKLNIGIRTEWMPEMGADGGSRQVNMPVIKHKITTQVPVKDGTDGTNDTGMALVYDPELMMYVLKHVSLDGQMSIFDMEEEVDDHVEEEQKMIEGSAVFMIEEKEEEENGDPEPPESVQDDVYYMDEEMTGNADMNEAAGVTEEKMDDPYLDMPYMDYDEPC